MGSALPIENLNDREAGAYAARAISASRPLQAGKQVNGKISIPALQARRINA
jgi:hypothetical protein